MAATVLGSLLVQLGMDSAEFDRGISRAQNSMRGAERQFTASGRAIQRSNGQTQSGMQQLSFQLNDIATQWASGTRPMQIFAQQSGQVVQAIALMSNGAGKFGAFMAGPWGMAITAGVVVLSALIPKLLETGGAMEKVELASNAMADAQSILGNVLDITTGKINTQSDALIALARAQLLAGKIGAQTRAAEARRGVAGIQDRPIIADAGFGGGLNFRRRPQDARDFLSREVLSGRMSGDTAIQRLDNLRRAGQISNDQFLQYSGSIANLGVEEANVKVFDEGLNLLNGTGGKSLLKTGGGGGSRRAGGGRTGPSQSEIDARYQTERAGFMQQYNSAMANMAMDAETAADFEMRNVELQRIRTIEAIKNNKDYSDAQKETLIAQAEEVVELERQQIERQKARRLEQEREAAARQDYDAQRQSLQIKADMAQTEQERKAIALELLALDQQFRRNSLEQIVASTTRTDAEKTLAKKALEGLAGVEAMERQAASRANMTRVDAYLASLQRTPAQINEAIDNIKVDALQNFNDQLVDALVNFKSLGDVAHAVLKQILADLLRLQIQQSLMPFLASALGLGGAGLAASGASSAGSGIAGLLGSLSGARAEGGPVRIGRSYLVGERGPEIFRAGATGTIIPNNELGSMGGSSQQIHKPTFVFPGITDARGAREAAGQAARRYRQEINGPTRAYA